MMGFASMHKISWHFIITFINIRKSNSLLINVDFKLPEAFIFIPNYKYLKNSSSIKGDMLKYVEKVKIFIIKYLYLLMYI